MDALVVSCGYYTTHVLPILGGQLQADRSRRINIGGHHMDSFMQRLLQLKYPSHFAALTLSRAEVCQLMSFTSVVFIILSDKCILACPHL